MRAASRGGDNPAAVQYGLGRRLNDRAGGSRRAPEQNSAGVDPRAARIVVRIRAIPEGFVRTYGDIDRHAPRLVGRVLATVDEDLPWHRVVRADGSLSQGRRQRALLAREGVPMRGDRVDMHLARLPAHL